MHHDDVTFPKGTALLRRWSPPLLVALNLAAALIASSPAFAQHDHPGVIDGVAGEFLRQGLLGVICVLEGVVIWFLFRQVQTANEKFLEMAVKQTEVFSEVARTMKRTEEMTEKVLDVVITRRS